MDWAPQQDNALVEVRKWLTSPGDKQLFRLFGYAGTGKTTLAKHLAEGIDGDVLFAAYTGKAASVLRASGASNACTLHSLIYTPKERSRERLRELKREIEEIEMMIHEDRMESGNDPDYEPAPKLKDRLSKARGLLKLEEKNASRPDWDLKTESPLGQASLLVVDECSMVDEDMAMDILSFNVPVLVLGDPAQLPPVRGTGYFTDAHPDIMLTEIHRQARDNPIIEMATRVRSGQRLNLGTYGDSEVIMKATPELALAADQVLVGRNDTRVASNKRMRQLKGYTSSRFPLAGEKLVCLRNDRETGLLNGTLWTAMTDADDGSGYLSFRIRSEDDPEQEPFPIQAHQEHFDGDPDQIGYWDRRAAQEMTYGYALTTHKAQGSQWGKVLIIDESGVFRQGDTPRRWLYTAITRAQDKVTVVRG